jgi:riboflavin biosynthesis pyrimidine reductase
VSDLRPFETCFGATEGVELPLPSELLEIYGPMRIPLPRDRPYVIANFVSTLDGVVTLGVQGYESGKPISGNSPHDRMVMGLLRAAVDAVVVGAGTFRASSSGRWTPANGYPPFADEYRALRRNLGKPDFPATVIVSARGDLDLARLPAREAKYLVVTTDEGQQAIQGRPISPAVTVISAGATSPSAGQIVELTAKSFGRLILVEGGPRLMGDFVAERCVDELFLTISPQVAGRNGSGERSGLVSGREFAPFDSRWANLHSVKRAGSHPFLRYTFPKASKEPNGE